MDAVWQDLWITGVDDLRCFNDPQLPHSCCHREYVDAGWKGVAFVSSSGGGHSAVDALGSENTQGQLL